MSCKGDMGYKYPRIVRDSVEMPARQPEAIVMRRTDRKEVEAVC